MLNTGDLFKLDSCVQFCQIIFIIAVGNSLSHCICQVDMDVLQVGKGTRYAKPIFCFSASCSNLLNIGSDKSSTDRPAYKAQKIMTLQMHCFKHTIWSFLVVPESNKIIRTTTWLLDVKYQTKVTWMRNPPQSFMVIFPRFWQYMIAYESQSVSPITISVFSSGRAPCGHNRDHSQTNR